MFKRFIDEKGEITKYIAITCHETSFAKSSRKQIQANCEIHAHIASLFKVYTQFSKLCMLRLFLILH